MRRGSFFPRRSATRSSTDSAAWLNDLLADRSAFAPFSGAPGVQLRARSLRRFAPLVGRRFRVSATPGPHAVRLSLSLSRPFSSGEFGRASLCINRCSADAPKVRGYGRSRLPGFAPFEGPTHPRPRAERWVDPALGFVLLQGFGRARLIPMGTSSIANAQSRGLDTAGDSLAPDPLVADPSALGFAAPFLRRCVPK